MPEKYISHHIGVLTEMPSLEMLTGSPLYTYKFQVISQRKAFAWNVDILLVFLVQLVSIYKYIEIQVYHFVENLNTSHKV